MNYQEQSSEEVTAPTVTASTISTNAYSTRLPIDTFPIDTSSLKPLQSMYQYISTPPCYMPELQQEPKPSLLYYQQQIYMPQHPQNYNENCVGDTVMAMTTTGLDSRHEQFDLNGNSKKRRVSEASRPTDLSEPIQRLQKLDNLNAAAAIEREIGHTTTTTITEQRASNNNPSNTAKLRLQTDAVDAQKYKNMSRDELIARLLKLENEKKVQSMKHTMTVHHQSSEDDNMSASSMSMDEDMHAIHAGEEEEDLSDPNHGSDEIRTITRTCLWYECGKKFGILQELITHLAEDHVGGGKPTYRCEWENCARNVKPFTKRHKMLNHLRTHTGERPFVCPKPDCGKKFSRPDSLTTHIKTHSTIKPYVCRYSDCAKAYYHARSLKKHERLHEITLLESMNNDNEPLIDKPAPLQLQQTQQFPSIMQAPLAQQSIEIPVTPSTQPTASTKSLLQFALTASPHQMILEESSQKAAPTVIPNSSTTYDHIPISNTGAGIIMPTASFEESNLSIFQQQHLISTRANFNIEPAGLSQQIPPFMYTIPENTLSPFDQTMDGPNFHFTMLPSTIPISQQAFSDIPTTTGATNPPQY